MTASAPPSQNVAPPSAPSFTLYLVDAVTGAQVQGPVPWALFYHALLQLCEQLGNIAVECESADDESVALFWQPLVGM